MSFKDNIDSKAIYNRKFVIELRFKPIASIIDKKGLIADTIAKANIFKPNNFWEISNNTVKFQDIEDKNNTQYIATVEYNRISIQGTKIDSVDSFFNTFTKFYNIVKENISEWTIRRIGCRILGAYKAESDNYNAILSNFVKKFPSQYLIDAYQVNNLSFKMEYASGMYQISPLKRDDEFYTREFPSGLINRNDGIMIDTDNYLLRVDDTDIDTIQNIKTIYIASLAVEKSLYDNLKKM